MSNALVPVTKEEALKTLGLTEQQVESLAHIKDLSRPADTVRALLKYPSVQDQMRAVMHRAWGSYDKLEAALVGAVAENPSLLNYPRPSLMLAMIQAAQLGLAPTGQRGGGWLIPRKGVITFQLSYTGVLHLVRRACPVRDVRAGMARARDVFSFDPVADVPIQHKQDFGLSEEERGERMVAWALIRTENAGAYPGVLGKDDMARILEHVKASSKGSLSHAWKTWTDQMYQRSALLRAAKLAPTKGADMDEDLENMGRVLHAETAEEDTEAAPEAGEWEENER